MAKLYPNPETSGKVMDYSIAHSTPLPDWLAKYHAWGCAETKVPTFLISTYQAQMLIFLARIVGAKKGESGHRQWPIVFNTYLSSLYYMHTYIHNCTLTH